MQYYRPSFYCRSVINSGGDLITFAFSLQEGGLYLWFIHMLWTYRMRIKYQQSLTSDAAVTNGLSRLVIDLQKNGCFEFRFVNVASRDSYENFSSM